MTEPKCLHILNELIDCQKAFNQLHERYKKLVSFVKTPTEGFYPKKYYYNLEKLLKEIGEL